MEPGPFLFQSLEALAEAKRLKAEAACWDFHVIATIRHDPMSRGSYGLLRLLLHRHADWGALCGTRGRSSRGQEEERGPRFSSCE